MKKTFIVSIVTILLLAAPLTNSFAQNKNTQVLQMKDNARSIPQFLDIGIFQTYRFTESEIKNIESKILHQVIETYIRRYYDLYLYFSRDIIAKQCTENYPPDLIDPVIQNTLNLGDDKLRSMLVEFYHRDNGVTEENKRLFNMIAPILNDWDQKKLGKTKSTQQRGIHSPNAIFLAYVKKLGIRPKDYYPPFYPKNEPENIIVDKKNENHPILTFIALAIALILGIVIGRKTKNLKT